MSNQPVYQIDGRYLYYTFVAGAQRILQSQTELNRINVFPVNDKDTGTNLASTVRSIIDNIQPDRSFTATAGVIADAALVGAGFQNPKVILQTCLISNQLFQWMNMVN